MCFHAVEKFRCPTQQQKLVLGPMKAVENSHRSAAVCKLCPNLLGLCLAPASFIWSHIIIALQETADSGCLSPLSPQMEFAHSVLQVCTIPA